MRHLKLASASVLAIAASTATAAAEDLTLCWAAWDPANALVELSKEFEAQSGHTMNFEFVPWPNFADRMLNELNSGGKLCDLLIGDSQWIGGGAENGHYVKLNDFFDKPKASPWTISPRRPSMPIRPGRRGRRTTTRCPRWAMRTAGSTARTGSRDATRSRRPTRTRPGRTWESRKPRRNCWQIAQFFQGREIDGKTVYGAAIFTERGSEGITMGVTSALYPLGLQVRERPRARTTWKAR